MDDLAISKNSIHPEKTEIIMYQTEDGLTRIDVRMEDETVWLTQAQMAELFQTTKQNISLHISNCFKEGELQSNSVVKESLTTAADGKNYPTKYYNLDVIISVGYRVKSLRGTQFRIWANSVLKEYLIKGFAMNDELLKQAGGRNYFDELMERIRDKTDAVRLFFVSDYDNLHCERWDDHAEFVRSGRRLKGENSRNRKDCDRAGYGSDQGLANRLDDTLCEPVSQ